MSFPCCLLACLRPSLFHAVQTYSQRQNKSPNDKLPSSYHSSKVKCYQTGIMPEMLAKKKKSQLQRQKKARGSKAKRPTAVPLARAAALQLPTHPAAAFALVSLSFHTDFGKFFQPGSTRTPPSPPQPLQLLCAPSRSYKTWGGWLKI